jgi:hypothetical protein
MIKKLLTLNLILVLVFQPVAVVFAGSSSLETQVANSYFSSSTMDCEHMNTLDCPGMDNCSNVGHTGCDVKSLRILSIVETVSLGLSHPVQAYKNDHIPLTETDPPLRPPRIS